MSQSHAGRRTRFSRRTLVNIGLGAGAAGALDLLAQHRAPRAALGASPAVGAPRRGGTLLAAQEVDPISLDPHTNANISALQGYEHMYESLTGYDEKMNVVPTLATRWETSGDGKVYTFHLRPGVKFHNGQTMIADDVKYSIERVLDPKTASPFRNIFAVIKEVAVLDPLTVRVALNEPYPGLLSEFAGLRSSGIIPNGSAERENLKLKAIGTGPFKLADYVPQDHLTYLRHSDYWDRPLPYLDGMTFKILTEENTRVLALRAGQIHYAGLSPQGAKQLGNRPDVTVLQGPFAWAAAHRLNVGKKPLTDARVRRALRMAVDTREVIQKAVFGAGVPTGPLPTGYNGWYLDPQRLPYLRPDLDGARKLLAEAGYPNGFTLTVKCSPQYPEFVASSVVLQEAVRKLGVTVNVEQLEWGTFLKATGSFDFELAATAWTFRPDPDGYLYPFFHSSGVFNAGPYKNARVDRLMEEARTTPAYAERAKLYQEIQRMLLDDVAAFWYYTRFNIEALSSKVQGYAQSFSGRRVFLKNAWLS
jgi:peptide/nickel transport system substrate-binding protein